MSNILIDEATVKLVLEALQNGKRVRNAEGGTEYQPDLEDEAITALREALAEQPAQQEPVAHQYQGKDGEWRNFIDQRHYESTVADGSWPIRALYTTPQPPAQQEPVTDEENEKFSRDVSNFKGTDEGATMYALERFLKNRTAPQPAQRKPLTDEQMREVLRTCQSDAVELLRSRWLYVKEFARAIEAKLRSKNEDRN
jgi:hypothetical protein